MIGLVLAVERALGEVSDLATVAVVGLAKNCGKTTALSSLVAGYVQAGHAIAVTSAGRDGEPVDVVTRRPKPALEVPPETVIATAEACLPGNVADRRVTDFATAFGRVAVARTTAHTQVELIGPVTAEEMVRLRQMFVARGVRRVLIDGAMDRLAVAAPRVSAALVLAVGAVLGATEPAVARQAAHGAAILSLPTPPAETRRFLLALSSKAEGGWLVDDAGRATAVPESLLMNPGDFGDRLQPEHRWLVTSGAVTEVLLDRLPRAGGLTVVARDPSRCLVSPEGLRRWRTRGGAIAVLEPARLAALTVNPHHPTGPDLDPDRLLSAVASAVPDTPVFDVARGTSISGEKGIAGLPSPPGGKARAEQTSKVSRTSEVSSRLPGTKRNGNA